MPAAFHNDFSRLCVPELSPREINGALARSIALRAAPARLKLCNFGRIVFRSNNDEIVVHHQASVLQFTVGQILSFQTGRVNQRNVGIALGSEFQRLACANRDSLHAIAALLFKQRHQHIEQTRILRAGRRRQDDIAARGISGMAVGGNQQPEEVL